MQMRGDDGCSVLEGDPHAVIEAIHRGYTLEPIKGYVCVRAEYPTAVNRLQIAINQAREAGLLGDHIYGTDFSFQLDIRLGSGAFVCGEETSTYWEVSKGHPGRTATATAISCGEGLFGK